MQGLYGGTTEEQPHRIMYNVLLAVLSCTVKMQNQFLDRRATKIHQVVQKGEDAKDSLNQDPAFRKIFREEKYSKAEKAAREKVGSSWSRA